MNRAEIEITVLSEAKKNIQAIYDYHKEKKIGATQYKKAFRNKWWDSVAQSINKRSEKYG
jgi:hypothetical protein